MHDLLPAVRAAVVSDLDRYLFDLNGYVVIPDALDPEMVKRLTDIVEARCSEIEREKPGQREFSITSLLTMADELRSLIDYEPIFPYLNEWLGEGFRLDHEYGLVMRPKSGRVGAFHIHGGGAPYKAAQSYSFHNGAIHCNETAVSYALTDVHPGEGGMGVIPGSHKSNIPLPWASDPGPYPDGRISPVPVAAGSAIIFTESLTHCTLPWRGSGSRRSLFYKYTPRNIQLGKGPKYDRQSLPGLTDRQRKTLEHAHS